jgi:MFS transporter, ACS family, D-galactonate transporter
MRVATADAQETRKISGQQWLLLGLLVLSIAINYIDRANLSVAVDDLRRELRVDDKQMGTLLSSFFWTYMLFQIPAGWLIDRFNVYWVYATGYFVWSLATALTGWATAFSVIFALRLLLGVAESVAYPSYSKIIAAGFPEDKRGLPNALIDAGSKMGPFLGVLIGGSIVAAHGWRVMFMAIGGISMLWLAPWLLAVRRGRWRQVLASSPFSPRPPPGVPSSGCWDRIMPGIFC